MNRASETGTTWVHVIIRRRASSIMETSRICDTSSALSPAQPMVLRKRCTPKAVARMVTLRARANRPCDKNEYRASMAGCSEKDSSESSAADRGGVVIAALRERAPATSS